jgi:uncharacterized protein YqhQ
MLDEIKERKNLFKDLLHNLNMFLCRKNQEDKELLKRCPSSFIKFILFAFVVLLVVVSHEGNSYSCDVLDAVCIDLVIQKMGIKFEVFGLIEVVMDHDDRF